MDRLAEDELVSVFEERAEHLDRNELERWTQLPSEAEAVVAKLIGSGAKLIIGPRGCGKSTLLRTAYYRCQSGHDVLPVYVNYSRSLALEPLFHRQANALAVFRQWLLMKIVEGLGISLAELSIPMSAPVFDLHRTSVATVRRLQRRDYSLEVPSLLGPSELIDLLENITLEAGRKRVVLLLDDAAHAFSPLQQREFFEIFRELKSRRVSVKAAVYPGVTSYSPNLHVGHDADIVQVWRLPTEATFIAEMRELFERRLPAEFRKQVSDEIVEYLALASFGIPRGFLNMLGDIIDTEKPAARATRSQAQRAVSEHAATVRAVFKSLTSKLPRYLNLVKVGEELDVAMVRTLARFNFSQREPSWKTNVMALEEPLGSEGERMVSLLEYAGVVRRGEPVSRGIKGRFQRLAIHNAIMLSEGAYSLGKSFPLQLAIKVMESTTAHAFARAQVGTLLGDDYSAKCRLNLPPCRKCGAARVSEQQLYCATCGSELADASLYEELLNRPIEELHLPPKKIKGIRDYTMIRTVQDILLDDELQTIRNKVNGVGPVWAKRILTAAEEYVSV